jgi:AcrR family transcriptional regulator
MVASRAGVTRNAVTDIFASEQECIVAAVDEGLARLSRTVDEAVGRKRSWLDRLRAGLVAFLGFLDDEPAWGRLLILEPPLEDRTFALRAQQRVLGVLTSLLDDGAPQVAGEFLPEPMLTAEFVIGGAVSVIRVHMVKNGDAHLVPLAPALMSFIVRPYLGQAAARAELAGGPARIPDAGSPAAQIPIRATHRTTLVLRAILTEPRSNNRQVADAAGLVDEGQTSKLLRRLERQGLVENVGVGIARGEPNAWLLTPYGENILERIESYHAPNVRALRSGVRRNGRRV